MARAFVRMNILAAEEKQERMRNRCTIREISEAYNLPENEFLHNYKITKDMIIYICDELYDELKPRIRLGYPVLLKVLNSLKLVLSGHYQTGTGQEAPHSVAQCTVSIYFDQFVKAVNKILKPKWIQFPGSPETRNCVTSEFLTKSGVSNILGAIDCTHINLFPPPGTTSAQYRNRHGELSINVQLVSNANGIILNCNANYPGKCHDQFIFNSSHVKGELSRLYNEGIGEYFLLGDSGYALEPWLMTPILNTEEGTAEERYTKWHCRTRNIIERTNGYLKGTFRCLGLDRRLHYAPQKASQIIYACCTLYNIMKHFRVPMTIEADVPEVEAMFPDQPHGTLLQVAHQRRQHIVNTYFN